MAESQDQFDDANAAFDKNVKGHPENKDVTLRLMPLAGG